MYGVKVLLGRTIKKNKLPVIYCRLDTKKKYLEGAVDTYVFQPPHTWVLV